MHTNRVANDRDHLVARFLQNACPDHHVRGGPAHVMALHTAHRLLDQHPEIAHDSIFTAVVCGDVAEVRRILAEDPEAAKYASPAAYHASDPGEFEDLFRDRTPSEWESLLYLCFTRLSLPAVRENAVEIATLLLDHGANPNASFNAGDSDYTPLVGVIGEGEENRPPHPRRNEIVKLLLERGAYAFDMQVTYNTHFKGDILWLLELQYEQSLREGRAVAWENPNWSVFDMGGYGCGARFLLGGAVDRNDLELAGWMLEHGANPNAPPPPGRNLHAIVASARLSHASLYEEAVRKGFGEMAELLARYGAKREMRPLEGIDAFTAACLRLDRREAESLLARHPEYLRAPSAMIFAAQHNRANVVGLLLDLGVSPDIEDPEDADQRPLHAAAYNDALDVARLLVDSGAKIDVREKRYSSTPLWNAVWQQHQRMIDFLTPLSGDVWSLAFIGDVERLREVLRKNPQLAKSAGEHETPLMWLPPDDSRAVEIATLFLEAGADPAVRNRQGLTAADIAEKRCLSGAAEFLRSEKAEVT